jgi:hypothetical protein
MYVYYLEVCESGSLLKLPYVDCFYYNRRFKTCYFNFNHSTSEVSERSERT